MKHDESPLECRRSFLLSLLGAAGGSSIVGSLMAKKKKDTRSDPYAKQAENERTAAMVGVGDKLRITKLETMLVQPRWLFLKIQTLITLRDTISHFH